MKVVRRNAWNVCKLLTSSASLGKVEGVYPKCWLVVARSHRFSGQGASSGMETANPFVKCSHDVVCLLTI